MNPFRKLLVWACSQCQREYQVSVDDVKSVIIGRCRLCKTLTSLKHGSMAARSLQSRLRERLAHFIAEALRQDWLIDPGQDDLTQVEALLEKLQKRRRR